jgi:hypothetical protein
MAYILKISNYVFSLVFLMEALIKLFALGFKSYFHNPWNKFDFFVVFSSIVDIIVNQIGSDFSTSSFSLFPQIIRVLRIFRITRILKLIKQVQGLKRLIDTIIFSLPSLLNVSSLLFLAYYIFSILSSFLFSKITYNDE